MSEIDLIAPAFEDCDKVIVLSCNDDYAPYCAATILSIINSSRVENKYDIVN